MGRRSIGGMRPAAGLGFGVRGGGDLERGDGRGGERGSYESRGERGVSAGAAARHTWEGRVVLVFKLTGLPL